MVDGVASRRDVAAKLGGCHVAERFADRVQRLAERQLRRGFLALHACQRQSGLTGEDADVLLERFLQQCSEGAAIPTAEDLDL